jgi:DNA-binding MarR family transcriptional regulator
MVRPKHTPPEHEQIHHPRWQLNEAIHQPVRLSLFALLAQSQKVDFAFLRDHLELGDSNLSRHLAALEELGYIVIEKVFEKKRARTWVSLSADGRKAFEEYVRVLHQLVEHPLDRADEKNEGTP